MNILNRQEREEKIKQIINKMKENKIEINDFSSVDNNELQEIIKNFIEYNNNKDFINLHNYLIDMTIKHNILFGYFSFRKYVKSFLEANTI